MWFGITQHELIAHWETLRALGDQDAKAEMTSVRGCDVGALPPVVSQCVQGFPMRNQFVLRNRTDKGLVRSRNLSTRDRNELLTHIEIPSIKKPIADELNEGITPRQQSIPLLMLEAPPLS